MKDKSDCCGLLRVVDDAGLDAAPLNGPLDVEALPDLETAAAPALLMPRPLPWNP